VRRRIISKPQFYTVQLLFYASLLIAGACLCGLLFFSTWSSPEGRRLSFEGRRAEATVTTVNKVSDRETYITFTWQQVTGSPRSAGQVVPLERDHRFGEVVTVIYDPTDPELYTLLSQRPAAGSLYLVFALFFLATAVFLRLRLARLKLRPPRRDACPDFIAEA
jgi:hypothetical protein